MGNRGSIYGSITFLALLFSLFREWVPEQTGLDLVFSEESDPAFEKLQLMIRATSFWLVCMTIYFFARGLSKK